MLSLNKMSEQVLPVQPPSVFAPHVAILPRFAKVFSTRDESPDLWGVLFQVAWVDGAPVIGTGETMLA